MSFIMLPMLILFILAEGFSLIPRAFVELVPGMFRLRDLFFVILPLCILYCFVSKRIEKLASSFTPFILIFCTLLVLNIVVANYNFTQSFWDGFITLRHYFLYMAFFIFVITIDSEKDLRRFFKLCVLVTVAIGLLSLVQYYFPQIRVLRYLEEGYYLQTYQGYDNKHFRDGVFRLRFPATHLSILVFCILLSQLVYPINANKPSKHSAFLSYKPELFGDGFKLFTLSFIIYLMFLTQVRMTLIGLLSVVFISILKGHRKRYKYFMIALVFLVIIIEVFLGAIGDKRTLIIDMRMIRLVSSSFTQAIEAEESSDPRYQQVLMYIEYFKKYPVFGAGTLQYQSPLSGKYGFAQSTDLGYVRLISEFGIVGLLWLLGLSIVFYRKSQHTLGLLKKTDNIGWIYSFTRGLQLYYLYQVVTFLTLPNFIFPTRILYVALALSLLEVSERITLSQSQAQSS